MTDLSVNMDQVKQVQVSAILHSCDDIYQVLVKFQDSDGLLHYRVLRIDRAWVYPDKPLVVIAAFRVPHVNVDLSPLLSILKINNI